MWPWVFLLILTTAVEIAARISHTHGPLERAQRMCAPILCLFANKKQYQYNSRSHEERNVPRLLPALSFRTDCGLARVRT